MVVNIQHIPNNWRSDQRYTFIGRPSFWGNPYRVIDHGRKEAINLYTQHIINNEDKRQRLNELAGKKLVCFCAPQECHGDILANLVNSF